MTPGPYPVVMSNGIGGWHSKYMVKGPGVVTGRSGTIGSLHYIEQNYWPHNTSLWVTSFNGNEPRFVYWLYASIGLERFGSGSGVPTLNRNDVHDLRVGFPCDVVEQRRIGTFFSRLDHLITLHQRERRKAPFSWSFAWEQRKLGELGRIETGNTPPTDNEAYYQVDGMPWATPTDIDGTPWLRTEKALSELGIAVARTVPAGSILCTCIASIGKNAITQTTCGFNQQINALAPKKDYYDSYFLFTESVIWSDQMKKSAAAATMQIVNKTEFSNLETSVPSLEEQRQIGSFFAELDNLITLHQ